MGNTKNQTWGEKQVFYLCALCSLSFSWINLVIKCFYCTEVVFALPAQLPHGLFSVFPSLDFSSRTAHSVAVTFGRTHSIQKQAALKIQLGAKSEKFQRLVLEQKYLLLFKVLATVF